MQRFPSPADRLTAVLGLIATAAWAIVTPTYEAVYTGILPVVLLFAAFMVAEWFPLGLEFRGQSFHSTLSGLVIVLGVIVVGPVPTLAARVVAGHVALRYRWANSWEKLRFNAAAHAAEVWVQATVFAVVAGDAALLEARTVVAILVAIAVSEAFSTATVLLVIRLTVGRIRLDQLKPTLVAILATLAISSAAATVASRLVEAETVTAVAFAGVLGLLIVTNRSRHALSQKHRSVASLYSFMEGIQGQTSVQHLLANVLEEAAEVTGAKQTGIVLITGDVAVRLDSLGAGLLSSEELPMSEAKRLVAGAVDGLTVDAGGRNPYLHIVGPLTEQLLLASFAHESVEGALVLQGRRGTMPKFDTDDVALACALARHAGVAVATSRLVDQLRSRSVELERSALRDPATQLLNFEGLVDAIPQLDAGTVMVAELLDLEMIDAAFGHTVSVEVAQSTADRLRRFGEEHGFTVGRIGPDRFAAVMPGMEHRLDAREAINSLRQSLRGPITRTHLQLEARFSFAAASAPRHGTDVGELLRRATNALVEHGADGSAEIAWFTSDLDSAATERLELASDLRRAIDNDGLSIAYQPKVNLKTGQIDGVEALARWAHPTRGYVSPAQFIDVAERTGLIRPLTLWVVDSAIRQAAEWEKTGCDISVAVNLSTVVMQEESLARHIIDRCREHEVPGHRLTLEITESQMMGDLERSSGILALFDAAGMRVSIDDFGTGYSSLAQLKGLPVDEVKIDRGFVTHLARDADDRAITEAILKMAKSLRLHVVAEGIEDQTSLDLLTAMGCDSGQGFHLHRPMSAEAVGVLLRRQDPSIPTVLPLRHAR